MTKTGRLNKQELAIYDQIGIYNKLIQSRSNVDTALLALNRDSAFFVKSKMKYSLVMIGLLNQKQKNS